jgi:hypothetical protein
VESKVVVTRGWDEGRQDRADVGQRLKGFNYTGRGSFSDLLHSMVTIEIMYISIFLKQ